MDRRLAFGDVAIMGGAPYSGKSWVLCELALAWAAGYSAFDWAPAFDPQRVLWIDEENSEGEAWTRIRAIAAARGLNVDDLRSTFFFPRTRQGFSFTKPAAVAELNRVVADLQPHWILFDSLVAIFRMADEKSNTEARAIYNDFLLPLIADHPERGIILLHHNRKPPANPELLIDPKDFNNLRGAGDLVAAVDSVLMIWRKDGNAHIHSAKARRDSNRAESPWDLTLYLHEANKGRYPKLCSHRPPQDTDQRGTAADVILALLRETKAPLTVTGIVDALSLTDQPVPRSTVYAALQSLKDSGQILAAGRAGRSGETFAAAEGPKH